MAQILPDMEHSYRCHEGTAPVPEGRMLGGETVPKRRKSANLVEIDGHVNIAQPVLQPVQGLLLVTLSGQWREVYQNSKFDKNIVEAVNRPISTSLLCLIDENLYKSQVAAGTVD
jgi:hypothetical protein